MIPQFLFCITQHIFQCMELTYQKYHFLIDSIIFINIILEIFISWYIHFNLVLTKYKKNVIFSLTIFIPNLRYPQNS